MDAELERWKAAGRYFDYLGFDIFYRVDGPPIGEAPCCWRSTATRSTHGTGR